MSFDRKYLVAALAYAIAGMVLGIFMASTKNHSQHVAHAHLLLVGFVASFVYGVVHKLWLGLVRPPVALTQFFLHHLGTVAMVIGLVLLYGNYYPESVVGPVLGLSSIALLAAAVLMFYMVLASAKPKP